MQDCSSRAREIAIGRESYLKVVLSHKEVTEVSNKVLGDESVWTGDQPRARAGEEQISSKADRAA